MLKIWDASNFRRTVGGLCLIVAPVLFAVAEITFPGGDGSPVDQLTAASQHRNLMLADIFLGLVAAILFIPAFFALLHVVRERGVVLAHIGAVLAVTGVALAHLALAGLQLMLWAMASPGVDRAAMVSFLNKTSQTPAALPLVLGHELFALGVIVLGIAVWRSGFGYRWAGPLASLGVILDIVLGTVGAPDLVASVVSDGLFVVGFAAIGYRVLALPDQSWAAAERLPHPAARANMAAAQA